MYVREDCNRYIRVSPSKPLCCERARIRVRRAVYNSREKFVGRSVGRACDIVRDALSRSAERMRGLAEAQNCVRTRIKSCRIEDRGEVGAIRRVERKHKATRVWRPILDLES